MSNIQIFSHSEIATGDECLAKYKHKYVNKIYPRKRDIFFVTGEAGHAFLEYWYKTQDIELAHKAAMDVFKQVDTAPLGGDDLASLRSDMSMISGICEAYPTYYSLDFAQFPKRMVEVERMGLKGIELYSNEDLTFLYQAKIDGLFQDAAGDWWILENKFLSYKQDHSDTFSKVHIDAQVLGYCWVAKEILGEWPKGIVYNIINKTLIRPKAGETNEAYRTRVVGEYTINANKKRYFQREDIILDHRHIQDWKRETISKCKVLAKRKASKSQIWPKSTGSCLGMFGRPCQYLPACKDMRYDRLLFQVPKSKDEKAQEEKFKAGAQKSKKAAKAKKKAKHRKKG